MKVLVRREDAPNYDEGYGHPAGTMARRIPGDYYDEDVFDEIELNHPVYLELRFVESEQLRTSVVLWFDVLGFYSNDGEEHVRLLNAPITRAPIRYAEFEKALVMSHIRNGCFRGWFTLDQKGPSVSLALLPKAGVSGP